MWGRRRLGIFKNKRMVVMFKLCIVVIPFLSFRNTFKRNIFDCVVGKLMSDRECLSGHSLRRFSSDTGQFRRMICRGRYSKN